MKRWHTMGVLAGAVLLLLSCLACSAILTCAEAPLRVHTHASGEGGIFANAYLVETEHGVVAIDAQLTESESRALRAKFDALGKPLLAVLITHGHPDHYNGVTRLVGEAQVPIIATPGVAEVIRTDDAAKEVQWRPVFKEEWPVKRIFPNRLLPGEQSVEFDGVSYTVHDLGAGESRSDSIWIVRAGKDRLAFIGDVVLHGVHAYTNDGHTGLWLQNIARVQGLISGIERIYPGHGDPGPGKQLLDWQRRYLNTYRHNVAELAKGKPQLTDAQKDELERRMIAYFNSDRLRFLIKLGADPVAHELAAATQRSAK